MAFQSNIQYILTPSGLLKIIELSLLFIAICIFRGDPSIDLGYNNTSFLVCSAMVMAFVISWLLLVCYLIGNVQIQKTIMEIVVNALFALLLLSGGAAAIDRSYHSVASQGIDGIRATASFCILASFAYMIDTFFAFYNFTKEE